MNKEFKKLEKENFKLRKKIIPYVKNLKEKEQINFWNLIYKLINNEIEQEKYCN